MSVKVGDGFPGIQQPLVHIASGHVLYHLTTTRVRRFSLRSHLTILPSPLRNANSGGNQPCHGFHKRLVETTRFRQDHAHRRLVAAAVVGFPGPVRFCSLFNLGGISGRSLPVWSVPFTVLFTGVVR